MTEDVHKLGEVLRAAREAKGVDLARVERETKIRERYLSALERGEYRELPGSVYTKGFLRNYGAYLGLDPEYLIDLYRLETSVAPERPRAPIPPRPIATRRTRALVVTPGAVVAAILTILVGAFIAYLGYEFINFARQPDLRIIDPAGPVSGYGELSMTVRGVTAPNARVTVSNLRENPSVTADADGNFELRVELVPGSNVMRVQARDPVTGRDSEIEERTITVVTDVAASPSAPAATLMLDQPAADASLSGAIPVAGTAAAGEALSISAALVSAAAPTFAVTDATGTEVDLPGDPAAPAPVSVEADANGAFSASLSVPPGTWSVSVAGSGDPVTRQVTVQAPEGLGGTLRVEDADSYLELEQDGRPVAGVSGGIVDEGESVKLDAERELRIRAGNAGAVRLRINGIDIGAMGGDGEVVEWRITRSEG